MCFSSEQTVSNLLQFEARSRCMEDRCLQFPMDRLLCFPTILSGAKSSSKSHTRQILEPSSCDPLVAFSTMVVSSKGFSHYTAKISEGNKKDFCPSSGPLEYLQPLWRQLKLVVWVVSGNKKMS